MLSSDFLKRAVRATGLALCGGLLSACALLSGGSPSTTFDLTRPAADDRSASASGTILVIPEPTALAALDSDRIVIKPVPVLVNYYEDSRWSDRLPRLVQARLLQAFENRQRGIAVGRPSDGLDGDYALVTDIRAFEVLVQPGPSAVIELSVKIVGAQTGRIAASRIFSANVPIVDDEIASGIAGLDAALQQILADVVVWASGRI